MSRLAYDMLTVQPMYLYPEDIEFLKANHPHVLKYPAVAPLPESYEIPPPIATTKQILGFLGANGWNLVKEECRMEADRLVCEYRKEKWKDLVED